MKTPVLSLRRISCIMACTIGMGAAYAQTYMNASSPSGGNSIPFGWNNNGVRAQHLMQAGDFGAVPGGQAIKSIYFFVQSGTIYNPKTYSTMEIKMGQPNITSLTTTWHTAGMTTVLSGTNVVVYPVLNNWMKIDLTTPMPYDPTKPLLVDVSLGPQSPYAAWYMGVAPTGSQRYRNYATPNTSASPTGAGPYALMFGFDLLPLNMDVISITFPADVCQESEYTVQVDVVNNDLNPQSGFALQYEINGVVQSTETHTATINAGDTGTFTFAVPIHSTTPGNFTLKANVAGKAPIADHNYIVKPSPLGSIVTQGSTFQGSFYSGTPSNPDVVAYGDNIVYEINPPTTYNNSDYSSTWTFSSWTFATSGGTPAGSSYTPSNPTSSANAMASFTPVIGQSDSTFQMCYKVQSLSNGCDAPEQCRTVFVAPRPIADFTASTACDKAPVQFDNNSTILSGSNSYLWDFGDGSTSVLVNPSHVYSSHGTYTVKLYAVSDYGYTDSSVQMVTVSELPQAAFDYINACEGDAVKFTDASFVPAGVPTYMWDFGDGNTSTSANPAHNYANTGSYEVNLTVTANGCKSSAMHYATYAPRANVGFTAMSGVCNNKEIPFTNNTTINSGTVGYSWNFGDNTTASVKDPKHLYTGFGNFTVKLYANTDLGCTDSFSTVITLIEAPLANFTVGSLCDKDNVSFTNTSTEPSGTTLTTYEWNFGDGNTSQANDPTHSFGSTGIFTVSLKAMSDNGCIDEEIQTIDIGEKPDADFIAKDVCEGSPVQFQNASVASGSLTYAWDFGDGNTSTQENPTHTFAGGANSHTIELTVTTTQGCVDMITKTVEVKETPVATLDPVQSGEKGDGSIVFGATISPGSDYIWFFGDGTKEQGTSLSGSISTVYTYPFDANFNVRLRVTKAGCASEASTTANVSKTSIAKPASGSVSVYPNPTAGVFTIDLSNMTSSIEKVEIYSSTGQLIRSLAITANQYEADMSMEAAGVYLVKVLSEGSFYTAKITVNR